MAESLVFNGNSSITKGTVIFEKGQPLQSTALILKGRVIVQGEGVRMTIGSGNFLGMCDVWKKEHSFTYVALDDLVLFGLPQEMKGNYSNYTFSRKTECEDTSQMYSFILPHPVSKHS